MAKRQITVEYSVRTPAGLTRVISNGPVGDLEDPEIREAIFRTIARGGMRGRFSRSGCLTGRETDEHVWAWQVIEDEKGRLSHPTTPRPPAELWGLWVVTADRPEGHWWNHIHGYCEHDDTPMTFASREDAIKSAEMERGEIGAGETMVVALIGISPDEAPR